MARNQLDLSHLRIIGCTAYVHESKDIRRKLDFNIRECRLVGYGGINQWRAWDEEKEDVVVSRDVIFDEQSIFTESEAAEIEVVEPSIEKPRKLLYSLLHDDKGRQLHRNPNPNRMTRKVKKGNKYR